MNKLKTFLSSFKRSVSDLSYYNDILKTNLSFSLKYLFFLTFVLSLVYGILVAVGVATFIPKIPSFVAETKTNIRNFYPGELVIRIKNGQLQTNVPEPYYLDLPGKYNKEMFGDADFEHFITIDTKASTEDYEKYKTAILVTKKSFVVGRSSGLEQRVYPLNNIKETVFIDKNAYDGIIKKILPYLDYLSGLAVTFIILMIFALPPFIAAFWGLGTLVYLIPAAFLVFIISKILKKELNYSKIYQLSIHAMTVPLALSPVKNLTGIKIPNSYNVLFLGIMILVLYTLNAKKEVIKKGQNLLMILYVAIAALALISAIIK